MTVPNPRIRILRPLLCGMLLWTAAQAQVFTFPSAIAAGSSSLSQQVAITIRASGTVGAISVAGQGNAGVDFIPAHSGTCAAGLTYTAGQVCTVGVVFAPAYPGSRSGAVVLTASNGTVLATHFLAGTSLGGLQVLIPGMISTVAGQATWLYNGDGEPAVDASIFLPFGIAVDSIGNMYIADQGNARIRKVSAVTGLISTIAGNGVVGAAGDGGLALHASFSNPSSVALDGAGNVFVSDSGNNVVRRISASTGIIVTVAGSIGHAGSSGDGGAATSATLNDPNGIAIDSAGNLFIADTANNTVRRVDAVTGVITSIAGTAAAGFSGDAGPATAARLNAPWGVTPAPDGVLYIADQGNNRIRMVDSSDIITTVAGTGLGAFSGDGGTALQAALDSPAGVVIDAAGDLYIADSGNNRVRKVTPGTGVITTIAGIATQSISGDGGPANTAGLYGPYSLALDGTGSLYIADVFHNRIRQVAANIGALGFQPMRVGRVSTPQQETLENDGNAAFTIASLQTVSNSVLDAPTTTCSAAQVLAPLARCVIGASFAPTSLGSPVQGVVSIAADAINAPAQIVLSGNVLDQDPSSVSLAASANPVTAGDTVVFTVTVTSGGTTPTGQVTLLDGATIIGSASLQSGGTVSFSLATLSGGQHSISAAYAGDSNNTSGNSQIIVEVVKFITAPTQTALAASTSSALAGKPVTLTATVALVKPGSGSGALSGSVTFSDGPTLLGAGSVSSSGNATLTLATLSIGQHAIIAYYSGASSFDPSTSAAITLTVQAATSTTSLSSGTNPSFGGAPVVLSVSVVSNGVTPSGTVFFNDGANPLGSATLNASSMASLSVKVLTAGAHSITASYAGDANNNGSVSAALQQTVLMASTVANVASSLNPAPQGGSIALSAAVKGNGGIPAGTVQFFDGTVSLANVSLDATGAATLSTAALGLGSHNITVTYQGDALDNASTSPTLLQTIIAATDIIALNSGSNPATYGNAITLTVAVQGTGAQPTGTVTLLDGPTSLGTQPLSSAGVAVFSPANLSIGAHTLLATYSGDTNHPLGSAAITQRVVQATSTMLVSSSTSAIAGTSITWTANVTGLNNRPVTGTVAFRDASATVATMPVDSTGTATFTSAGFSIGSHTMSAVYSGDQLDQSSSSTPLLQTVQIASTSTSLASSANPAFAGAPLTLTANVTGNGAMPSGAILFRDGTVSLASVTLSATGVASLSIATLSPGTHVLTAVYSGDTNDSASTSASLTQSIVQQTTLTTYSSANPAMFKDSVAITVTVSGGLATYPASGMVMLTDGTSPLGSAPVDALGNAHFALNAPLLGQHLLSATYAGDLHNSPATAPVFTQDVILRPTTNVVNVSSTALSAGQSVTLLSLVQGVGPNFPTGVVTFVSGASVLGTATLNANGLATLTFSPPQGTYNFVAKYPGDTLFAASTSTTANLVVGPTIEFTMTVTPASVSLASGDHTTLNIAIATASSFNDTLAIGCAGLPASATCTFSSNNVKVAGGSGATLSVVLDTGNPLGAGASASVLPGGLLLALLLAPMRRFRKRFSTLAALLIFGMAATLSGCASSIHMTDTPPGTYTVQVVGTGASTGATQTGTIVLTVTPQ